MGPYVCQSSGPDHSLVESWSVLSLTGECCVHPIQAGHGSFLEVSVHVGKPPLFCQA